MSPGCIVAYVYYVKYNLIQDSVTYSSKATGYLHYLM